VLNLFWSWPSTLFRGNFQIFSFFRHLNCLRETLMFIRSRPCQKSELSTLHSGRHIAVTMSSKRPFPVQRSQIETILCSNRSDYGGKSRGQVFFFVTSGRGPLTRPNAMRSRQLNWPRPSSVELIGRTIGRLFFRGITFLNNMTRHCTTFSDNFIIAFGNFPYQKTYSTTW